MNSQIICSTCGTYYPADQCPEPCTICSDDRQYIPEGGQRWTLPAALHERHSIRIHRLRDGFYELEVNPQFAIGQRALLVCAPGGNVLWDCIPMLDEATLAFIRSKGGIRAIAFSHPHYYSNMNDWAAAFDCPVYIHENDSPHIMVKGPHIHLWKGEEMELWDGMSVYLVGGHFEGSCLLRVPFLSAEGAALCGDTLFLSPSKKHFSVLRSYPNRIPLSQAEMKRVVRRLSEIPFDSFYGYIRSQNLDLDVRERLRQSMDRYFR